uniref:Putative c2h2-type zn-finger protein n=1 Tax=Culex tarsalis TaxID=7177 RepID=A0A1Q3EZ02_CULTA
MVTALENFPDVCRLCLRPGPEPEMAPILGTVPEFGEQQLSELLDDFCSPAPEDINSSLPGSVCEQCVHEFLSAFRLKRRLELLFRFQVAYARFKFGQPESLRQLFEDGVERLDVVLREAGTLQEGELLSWEALVADSNSKCETIEMITEQVPLFEIEMLDEAEAGVVEKEELEDDQRVEFLEMEIMDGVDSDEAEVMANVKPKIRKKIRKVKKVAASTKLKLDEPLQCIDCNYTTHYEDSFEVHMQNHQKNDLVCRINSCQQEFDSKEALIAHKKSDHLCCVCDICGFTLKNKYSLEVHVRRHKGETRFPCQYCSSSFHTKQEYKLHLSLVHVASETVSCEICQLEFKNMQFLRRHLKSHSDERSYKCPECDKTFKTIMHVHRHKETVHLKVRFQCEHCEMSYGRKDKLRMHVERVHNIQMYFICEICLKSFSTADQLQEHADHHANPKPLECGVCLVIYLTQEELDGHLCISYRDDYLCCGRDHKFHTFYNKHMFLAHGQKTNVRVKPAADKLIANMRAERKYIERCAECGKVFPTRKLKLAHRDVCERFNETQRSVYAIKVIE